MDDHQILRFPAVLAPALLAASPCWLLGRVPITSTNGRRPLRAPLRGSVEQQAAAARATPCKLARLPRARPALAAGRAWPRVRLRTAVRLRPAEAFPLLPHEYSGSSQPSAWPPRSVRHTQGKR